MELRDVMEALTILLVIILTFAFIIVWAKIKKRRRK